MTDDVFGRDGDNRIEAIETRASVSRPLTTTDRLDTMFDVLCNARRRYLLYDLIARDEAVVELEAAVEAVTEYETEGTGTVTQSSWNEVKIALHHNHLPRLANTKLLDYDRRQGTIRLTEDAELEEWIEFAQSKELE